MLSWSAPPVPRLPGRGQQVRVTDTATGVPVQAAAGEVATMYVCGITPYDATHLGHAATYVAFDLLHRAWLDAGLEVRYASNVTDVDDPLLERAAATGVDWRDLAVEQTALFAEDMIALRVLPPHVYLGAVESIPNVVEAVSQLLGAGAAYRVPVEQHGIDAERGGTGASERRASPRPDDAQAADGDVYADIRSDALFGTVSHLQDEAAAAVFGERGGDPDRPGKRDPLDPALWRRERPGEPSWDGGVLGSGRPGWHIECAVIAREALGSGFDVQGGGRDLVFPHHEMSSSHVRALGGEAARVNVHAGMVGYQGEKMSKSLGNLVLVSRLREQGVDPMAVRLDLLTHHYSEDWGWTQEGLDAAEARLARWRAAAMAAAGPDPETTLVAMRTCLAADLDAPGAVRAVDSWADAALSLGGRVDGAPQVVVAAVDALLGVRL